MSPNAWKTVTDIVLNGTFYCSREFGRRHTGLAMLLAPREDREPRAEPGELERDGLAEAGAAARHDHRLALEAAERQRMGAERGRLGQGHRGSPRQREGREYPGAPRVRQFGER